MRSTDFSARYTDNHEWARQDGQLATIGMTDFGQACFKTITLVELPALGAVFRKGEVFCTLESSKAANEVEMPLTGTVIEVNARLLEEASLINTDCYGDGWLVKIKIADHSEMEMLMTSEEYSEEIGVFFRKVK